MAFESTRKSTRKWQLRSEARESLRHSKAMLRRYAENQQVDGVLAVGKRKPLGAERSLRYSKFASENQR